MNAARYAIYFAPSATHPLWAAGSAWLGRDAADREDRRPPSRPEVATPWHYGFHATLKAPMRLAPGMRLRKLQDAIQALTTRHRIFEMPPLVIGALGDFLALRPAAPLPSDHPLERLAADAVQSLDACRAPLSDAERTRHGRADLDERQRASLLRWGYPHVLENWRFHLTLTGSLAADDPVRVELHSAAGAHFAAALATPMQAEDVALFEQLAPGEPFHLRQRFALQRG